MALRRDTITIIRSYNASDLDALLAVWEGASTLAHPFLSKSFIEKEKLNIPNIYLPNADTWVLLEQECVVAFIALIGNEVGALFVSPNHHRKGFGKALMDKARSLHDSLELDVFKENVIGRCFYDGYGFTFLRESVHEDTGQPVLRLRYGS